MSAIHHLQVEEDLGISHMAKLELVLRGVKVVQATKQQAKG